jgi:arsenate reductase
MSTIVYGIRNCDTVKKARAWLDGAGIAYDFHDYKTQGVDRARLEGWVERRGWEVLLNRAGTTFRNLAEADKADLDAARAVALMCAQPSMIKRPVVEADETLLVGFKPAEWQQALGEGDAATG